MLATPPPVIINMPDTGAPWWYAPVAAGLFVVLGSLITYLSTKASDKRKAKREEKQRTMSESRQAAMDVIEAARSIERLTMMQQRDGPALPADQLTTLASEAETKLDNAWSRFHVFGDGEAIEAGTKLMVAVMMLKNSVHSEKAFINRTADFIIARSNFVDILRADAGLSKLSRPVIEITHRDGSSKENGDLLEVPARRTKNWAPWLLLLNAKTRR